jgi:hypothetical protein
MSIQYMLLNTVSYAAMILPSLMDEEVAVWNSEDYLRARKRDSKNRMMAGIYQTVRSGKRLPMFLPEDRIQPRPLIIKEEYFNAILEN